jgi:hypothetical protein
MQGHIFFNEDYKMEEFWDYNEDERYVVKK